MAVQDTQNSILVGGAALAQFYQAVQQHPQPKVLAATGVNLAVAAVSALSPTSKALPWLQAVQALVQALFFAPQPPPQSTMPPGPVQ